MSDWFTYRLHPDDRRLLTAILDEARDGRRALNLKMERIMATQAEVKAKLDALTADVADETTQIGGIEQVLDNLAKVIADLKAAASKAEVPQAIVDQIDALAGAVGQNKTRIVDDIKKNTPAG